VRFEVSVNRSPYCVHTVTVSFGRLFPYFRGTSTPQPPSPLSGFRYDRLG